MATQGKRPDGLPVKYLGGFAGRPVKALSYDKWFLASEPNSLDVWIGSQSARTVPGRRPGLSAYLFMKVRSEPWDSLRMLALTSGSATRANLPALAVFGPLGLAARREPGTYIAVSFADGDVFFFSKTPLHQMQGPLARFAVAHPLAAGKIFLDGEPLGTVSGGSSARQAGHADEDVLAKIRELGVLRDQGVVTNAEFDAKKAELLARL